MSVAMVVAEATRHSSLGQKSATERVSMGRSFAAAGSTKGGCADFGASWGHPEGQEDEEELYDFSRFPAGNFGPRMDIFFSFRFSSLRPGDTWIPGVQPREIISRTVVAFFHRRAHIHTMLNTLQKQQQQQRQQPGVTVPKWCSPWQPFSAIPAVAISSVRGDRAQVSAHSREVVVCVRFTGRRSR